MSTADGTSVIAGTPSSGWSVSSSSGERCVLARLLVRLGGRRGGVVGDDLEQDRGDVVVAAAAVRRTDERLCGSVEVTAVREQHLLDRLARDHVGETVGAEEIDVARLRDGS